MKIPFAIGAMILFAICAFAETTNAVADAEIQGRQLVQKLLELRPAENFTNTGRLQIRQKSRRDDFPFQFQAMVTSSNWQAIYETTSESYRVKFVIIHDASESHFFEIRNDKNIESEPTSAFANSDFWLCDLGLEFFHWPQQKV
ncbi:MAG: hypothetical protein WDM76_12835 [Limisphaerales bacterium]